MEDSAASCNIMQISEVSEWRTQLSRTSGKLMAEGRNVAVQVNKCDLGSTPDNRESLRTIEATCTVQQHKVPKSVGSRSNQASGGYSVEMETFPLQMPEVR
jgi:hypothetical protein